MESLCLIDQKIKDFKDRKFTAILFTYLYSEKHGNRSCCHKNESCPK